MRFSERYGYKPVRDIIQKESVDDHLRNGIWSVFHLCLWSKISHPSSSYSYTKNSNLNNLINKYWFNFFKKPNDTIPLRSHESITIIRNLFFKFEWHTIYSFIEETLENYPTQYCEKKEKFIEQINQILERENSAYRIINDEIIPITSEQEIQSIEEALENTNPYSGVQQHLNQALKLLSDRQNPDYRNSIKESISAVESICKIVTNEDKATLGKTLKIIEDKHGLHAALKGSLSQLYGYTSDADGIRHAMLEESNLSYIDAKFMLVACTNFINYLIEKTK
ncbi:AbiJ-NTD4 domain-containing protein [Acinetobacter sp. TSRC1-2]|uniref:AbiJ-NTD4 domain-containing protein n=1 Tax=unclassified Acinetobacter TaxID=196816 RepID=UPI003CF57291